jgi:hypothetical protein
MPYQWMRDALAEICMRAINRGSVENGGIPHSRQFAFIRGSPPFEGVDGENKNATGFKPVAW